MAEIKKPTGASVDKVGDKGADKGGDKGKSGSDIALKIESKKEASTPEPIGAKAGKLKIASAASVKPGEKKLSFTTKILSLGKKKDSGVDKNATKDDSAKAPSANDASNDTAGASKDLSAATLAIPAITAKPADTGKPVDLKPDSAPKKESKTFQTLFSKKKEEKKDSKMITSVLKRGTPTKIKPILGAAPTLQKSIEEDKVATQKSKLRTAQIAFLIVFLLSLGSVGYFYMELSPNWENNSTARLVDVNTNLRTAQTTLNKYRYLAAQLNLNTFSFVSDEYLDTTSQLSLGNLSAAATSTLTQQTEQAVNDLPELLSLVRENLIPGIVFETVRTEDQEEEKTEQQILTEFETDLKNALMEDRKMIAQSETLSEENAQDLRLIDNTLKLVGNNKLLGTIKGVSVQNFQANLAEYTETLDPLKRETLQSLMGSVLGSTKSDIATVGAIKAQRILWSWIVEKIEEVTIGVDPNFNSGLFEVTGLEVFYNGYEFNTNTNKIGLSGATKTDNAKNFSVISDLIDAFEASPYFEEVSMRSFTKSGTVETGFTANFQFDLKIELEGMSPKNKPISLVGRSVAAAIGVQRIK